VDWPRAVARARDLGIRIGTLEPGTVDAITDVAGVRVGHTTLVSGEDVRTGVTVVLPHEAEPWAEPVFAGAHRLNGSGELTGLTASRVVAAGGDTRHIKALLQAYVRGITVNGRSEIYPRFYAPTASVSPPSALVGLGGVEPPRTDSKSGPVSSR